MDITTFILVAIPFGIMIFLSISANRRFSDHASLPMQWTASGDVSWSAPRALALMFIPVFAAVIVAIAAFAMTAEGGAANGLILGLISLVFLGAYVLHIRLLMRRIG